MAKLNTSFLFSEKKNTSVPMAEVPRNLKEALNIDEAYPDGIFKIEPGTGERIYDKCYIFEDVNYIGQDADKKNSTLTTLVSFFKSQKYQYKICVANERGDIYSVVDDFLNPLHEAEYPIAADGIGQWVNQKIEEGTRDIKRLLYLVVTCRANSYEDAKAYFFTLDVAMTAIFSSLRSRLYQMSAEERFVVLQKLLRAGDGGIVPVCKGPKDNNWKQQILPVSIDFGEDCMQINNKYVSVLFAQDFASTLNEEKVLHTLTDSLFPVFITLDFEPISQQLLKDMLVISNANNEQSITTEKEQQNNNMQYGRETSYGLRTKKSELEGLLKKVDTNDEEGVFLSMLVMVPANSVEELEQRVETLSRLAALGGYALEPCYHMQLKALNTVLPIGGRQFNHMHPLLTSSAVAYQPFYSRDLLEKDGQVFGLNGRTKNLIIANRKKLKSPHAIIGGHTGSGKSVFMKTTEVCQTLMLTNDDIFAIDPNNEMESLTKMLGGAYFDLTPQGEVYLNPLWVPKMVWEADRFVKNRHVGQSTAFVRGFVASCMEGEEVTQLHLNLVSDAVEEIFTEYFSGEKYEAQPTLERIWNRLLSKLEHAQDRDERKRLEIITGCMKQYIAGQYDMFAKAGNIDLDNRLVVFGLRNIPSEIWETAMYTLVYYIRTCVMYNQQEMRASHFIVDEAQVLCKNAFTAKELTSAVETYRKYGGIITLLFQNFKHALENPDIRDMLSNASCKIFFDQGGVDAAALATIQELSEDEYNSLAEKRAGYGLLIWDTDVYKLDARFDVSNALWPYLDTNFHKKAEAMEEEAHKSPEYILREKIMKLLEITEMDKGTLKDMCISEGTTRQIENMILQMKRELIIEEQDGSLRLKK